MTCRAGNEVVKWARPFLRTHIPMGETNIEIRPKLVPGQAPTMLRKQECLSLTGRKD